MRDDERETINTVPPIIGFAVVRTQPRTIIGTIGTEQDRITIGILDELMHNNDPPETHQLNLLVGKSFTDEASDFGVRSGELAFNREGVNLLDDLMLTLEKTTSKDGDFCGDAVRVLEVWRTEHTLGVLTDSEALLLETLDPPLTCRTIRGD